MTDEGGCAGAGGERAVLQHLGVVDEGKLRYQDGALAQWMPFVMSGRVRCKLSNAVEIVGPFGLAFEVFEALESTAAGDALVQELWQALAHG